MFGLIGLLMVVASVAFVIVLPFMGSSIIVPFENMFGDKYYWVWLGIGFVGFVFLKLSMSSVKYYCAKCDQFLGTGDDERGNSCPRCGSNRTKSK